MFSLKLIFKLDFFYYFSLGERTMSKHYFDIKFGTLRQLSSEIFVLFCFDCGLTSR